MLRDLIFALRGCPGSIFKEMSSGKIEVVSGLSFNHPSEENILNSILHLGTHYLFFAKFIKAHSTTLYSPGEKLATLPDGLKHGCYLKSFCLGLQKVLSNYCDRLLDIEKKILENDHLSLTYIIQELIEYHVLFDALFDTINVIKSRKSHGGQILDVLFKASHSGNNLIKESMLLILHHCHTVMYNQLSSWVLHGILVDRHQEFFIGMVEEKKKNTTLDELTMLSGIHVSNRENFEVKLSFLPMYIPSRIATVIHFIGSSLHLFEFKNNNKSTKNIFPMSKLSLSVEQFHPESILKEKENEFIANLRQLKLAKEFFVEDFEKCIDVIRSAVAKELWNLCVEKAQLVSHLVILKDFFLLGRGELFLTFLDEAESILREPPSKAVVTEHDVQQAFVRSALRSQIEDEIPFDLVRLTISPNPNPNRKVDTGWSRLGMSFNIKWPLHTIFKPVILEKYNQLFQFLLLVRRTQAKLKSIWILQMEKKQASLYPNRDNSEIRALRRLEWTCQSQMQFFIDNLQYYLQADVLESHFSNLLNKIRTTDKDHRDFESVIVAHEQFIHCLMAQCFIFTGMVKTVLMEIIEICQQFSKTMLIPAMPYTFEQLTEIETQFYKKTCFFFQVLLGLSNTHSNPHIALLTLRLDYNHHFTSALKKQNEMHLNIL